MKETLNKIKIVAQIAISQKLSQIRIIGIPFYNCWGSRSVRLFMTIVNQV